MAITKHDFMVPNSTCGYTGGIKTIEIDSTITFKKAMYSREYSIAGVANNAYLTIGITVPSGYEIHVTNLQLYGLDGPCRFLFYPFGSFTQGSTFLTPRNHFIAVDSPAAITTFNTDPTDLNTSGVEMKFQFGGGSTLPTQHDSSIFSPAGKYIISAGQHILRVQNISGDVTTLQVVMHWYEMQL